MDGAIAAESRIKKGGPEGAKWTVVRVTTGDGKRVKVFGYGQTPKEAMDDARGKEKNKRSKPE